jgi:hypothetical protein
MNEQLIAALEKQAKTLDEIAGHERAQSDLAKRTGAAFRAVAAATRDVARIWPERAAALGQEAVGFDAMATNADAEAEHFALLASSATTQAEAARAIAGSRSARRDPAG